MKATGIVRRIDDLRRVVIPKEIRRTMRIREGDPLQITLTLSTDSVWHYIVWWRDIKKKRSEITPLSLFLFKCYTSLNCCYILDSCHYTGRHDHTSHTNKERLNFFC